MNLVIQILSMILTTDAVLICYPTRLHSCRGPAGELQESCRLNDKTHSCIFDLILLSTLIIMTSTSPNVSAKLFLCSVMKNVPGLGPLIFVLEATTCSIIGIQRPE